MAKDPTRDKPSFRNLPTGTARPVTNSVERAREHFKSHPEPAAPPSSRKNVRPRKPHKAEEPTTDPGGDEPGREGAGEEED